MVGCPTLEEARWSICERSEMVNGGFPHSLFSHFSPNYCFVTLEKSYSPNKHYQLSTYLVKRIKAMKLSDFKGKNVDKAVSTIKSVTSCSRQCLTDVRNYVPNDLPEIVLKIFQTSSVRSSMRFLPAKSWMCVVTRISLVALPRTLPSLRSARSPRILIVGCPLPATSIPGLPLTSKVPPSRP